MDLLIYLAEAWWPLYVVHFVEVSLFILLVWAVDRWMTLDTRLRYVLYLLALTKVFVPPFYAIPLPEFLTFLYPAPSYSVTGTYFCRSCGILMWFMLYLSQLHRSHWRFICFACGVFRLRYGQV